MAFLPFYDMAVPDAPALSSRMLTVTMLDHFVGTYPPIAPGELVGFGMDFSDILLDGDSIVSVTSAVSALGGTDDNAAQLAATPLGIQGTQVLQSLGPNWLIGNTYSWTVTIKTAFQEIEERYTRIVVVPI